MAKKLKIKLPKRVAGIKIPKVVRKGPVAEFLNSSAGQLILAETLVAAAGVFTVAKTDPDSPVGEAARHPLEASRRVGRTLAGIRSDQSERLSHALKEAARAFREAMQNDAGPGTAWTDAAVDSRSEDAGGKKKPSSRAPH